MNPGHDLYTPTDYVGHHTLTDHLIPFGPDDARVDRLMVGKIIQTRPEEHTVDVRLDNGEVIRHVAALTPYAGTKAGIYRVPQIKNVINDADSEGSLDSAIESQEEDSWCLVGFVNGRLNDPFIVGSFMPQVNEINNHDIHFIDRHFTDDVELITNDGHRNQYTNDLSGTTTGWDDSRDDPWWHDPGNGGPKNFDHDHKPWQLKKTNDFYIAQTQQSGKTRTKQWTDGRVSFQQDNDTVIEIHKDKEISITSPKLVCINAPKTTINGDLYVNGNYSSPGTANCEAFSSPSGGVPGPFGAAGSPGTAGPVVEHDVEKEWHG